MNDARPGDGILRWWWWWWRVRGRAARNAGSSYDRPRALSPGSRAATRHLRGRSAPPGQARHALFARAHSPRVENENLGELVGLLDRDAVRAQEVAQEPPFERELATRHHLNEPLRSHPSRILYPRPVPRATSVLDNAATFARRRNATLRHATPRNAPTFDASAPDRAQLLHVCFRHLCRSYTDARRRFIAGISPSPAERDGVPGSCPSPRASCRPPARAA